MKPVYIELGILAFSFVCVLVVVLRFLCSDLPEDFLSKLRQRSDEGGK